MEAQQLFRDRWRLFTPNGRPRRKPIKLVKHFSLLDNIDYYDIYATQASAGSGLNRYPSSLRPPLSKEALTTPTPCTYNITSSTDTVTGVIKYHKNYFDKPNEEHITRYPTPCTYNIPRTIGTKSQSMKSSPCYSIGKEKRETMVKRGTSDPGPCSYFSKSETNVGITRPLRKPNRTRLAVMASNDRVYPLIKPVFALMGTATNIIQKE